VSAASAAVNVLLPEGGLKKYVSYIVSLAMLLMLLSPIKSIVSAIAVAATEDHSEILSAEWEYDVDKIAESQIKKAVSEKFAVPEAQISCEVNSRTAYIQAEKRIGIVAEDIELFVNMNFGLEAEVWLYEREG